MKKIDIKNIQGIPETMLIPLWARAVETKRENPIIRDDKAVEMIHRIDYDFSKFDGIWTSQAGCAIRAEILDNETIKFLNANKGAIVVNLGCGLDTRGERLRQYGAERWYDMDLPESIELRKHFFTQSDYLHFIPKSVFDFTWIDDVEQNGKPVLFIAEGLFMYFKEDELKELFNELINRFPNPEMLLEATSPLIVGKSKHHDAVKKIGEKAEFKWGIGNAKALEAWNPRIRYIEEWNYADFHLKRWRFLRYIRPVFRKFNNKIIHLKFDK